MKDELLAVEKHLVYREHALASQTHSRHPRNLISGREGRKFYPRFFDKTRSCEQDFVYAESMFIEIQFTN